MKPVKFKAQNCTYAENQKEYLPLPAYKDPSPEGYVISCWQLSFKEKVKLLFGGKIWLSLMSFHKPLTPSFLTVNKKDVLLNESKNE